MRTFADSFRIFRKKFVLFLSNISMKVGVFHWAFDFFGGGEKVAMDIAKALGLKEVYTLFSSAKKDGIEAVDISYLLPRWAKLAGKITKRKRARILDMGDDRS